MFLSLGFKEIDSNSHRKIWKVANFCKNYGIIIGSVFIFNIANCNMQLYLK